MKVFKRVNPEFSSQRNFFPFFFFNCIYIEKMDLAEPTVVIISEYM